MNSSTQDLHQHSNAGVTQSKSTEIQAEEKSEAVDQDSQESNQVDLEQEDADEQNHAEQDDGELDFEQTQQALQNAKDKIEQLQEQISEQKQQSLRVLADAENTKRRALNELDKVRKFATESLIKNLLPVLDSCQSAKSALNADDTQTLEGIELIQKSLLKVLQENGVEEIAPSQGEAFNPELHQAMTTLPCEKDQEPNQVVEVFQVGFTLNQRLLRPALVVVTQ